MSVAIDQAVLYLNRNYQPVGIRSLRRAFKKLVCTYAGTDTFKAMVLDPETYATWTWAEWSKVKKCAPEIIVLSRYADTPTHKIPFSRRAIYKRDHYTCQYCSCQPGPEELTIDHVVPKSRKGISSWENCVLSCVSCNARKANRTPAEAGMRLKRLPKRPRFMPFFSSTPRIASWEKFLGAAYWSCELKD